VHDIGLTPFQRAVKSCAQKEILTAFNVYDLKDTRHSPDADVKILPQLQSEDRTCAESECTGLLPMSKSMHIEDMVLTALYRKMPIQLGSVSADGLSSINYQGSTKFWWSIATDRSGIHFNLVEKVLSDFTTFSEVIALARVTDSDGESNVFGVAHPSVLKMISDNLCLCGLYELHLRLPEKSAGLLIYKAAANDTGEYLSKILCESSTATSSEASTRGVLIHCTRMNSDRDLEMLREVEMHQTLHMLEKVFQRVINHHVMNGRRFGCPYEEVRLVRNITRFFS